MIFFEYLQNASTEKVHSQFLGWLFSQGNLGISDYEKIKLLNILTNNSISDNEKILQVYTENQNIDILIKLDNQVVIIENKIKISQSINQLKKYEKEAENLYPNLENHSFVFLSLIDEKPKSDNWLKVTYKQFLTNGLFNLEYLDHHHRYIIKEYITNLSLLTDSIEAFIESPESMTNIFTLANKKKYEKIIPSNINKHEKYICRNNLETIAQKYLYQKIIEDVKNDFQLPIITETRGNALIDLKKPIDKSNDNIKVKTLSIAGFEYDFGIQIQSGSIKIQIELGYHKNGRPKKFDQKKKNIIDNYSEKIYNKINEISYKRNKLENEWIRFNKSKAKRSIYMSASKGIKFNDGQKFYRHNFFELRNVYLKEIKNCQYVIDQLSKVHF